MIRIPRYVKAIAAAVGSFAGVAVTVAADDSVAFDEFGIVAAAVTALVAAVITAVSPANES